MSKQLLSVFLEDAKVDLKMNVENAPPPNGWLNHIAGKDYFSIPDPSQQDVLIFNRRKIPMMELIGSNLLDPERIGNGYLGCNLCIEPDGSAVVVHVPGEKENTLAKFRYVLKNKLPSLDETAASLGVGAGAVDAEAVDAGAVDAGAVDAEAVDAEAVVEGI